MWKSEKALLEWADRRKEYIFVPVLTLVALLLRFPLRNVLEGAVTAKYLAIFGDLLLAGSVSALVYLSEEAGHRRVRRAVLAYAVVLFSPVLFFSSAVFGYVQSLEAVLLIWSAAFFRKDRFLPAAVLWGMALVSDRMGLVLLPYVVFLLADRKHFSAARALTAAAAVILGCMANCFANGLLHGLLRMPEAETGVLYSDMASFWTFLENTQECYELYGASAYILFIMALVILGCCFAKAGTSDELRADGFRLFLFAMAFGLLRPSAGGGELWFAALLALVLALYHPVLLLPGVLLNMVILVLYAARLYGGDWMPLNLQGLSLLALGIFAAYLFFYKKHLTSKRDRVNLS